MMNKQISVGVSQRKSYQPIYRVSPFVSPLVESFGELGLWELEVGDVVDATLVVDAIRV